MVVFPSSKPLLPPAPSCYVRAWKGPSSPNDELGWQATSAYWHWKIQSPHWLWRGAPVVLSMWLCKYEAAASKDALALRRRKRLCVN
jgi:hypothetical protein